MVSFPTPTDKWTISRPGASRLRWRCDGKELFYLGANASIYAESIQEGVSLSTGAPVPLFETRIRPDSNFDQYGVVDNGQRFLVLERVQPGASLTFVLDWHPGRANKRRMRRNRRWARIARPRTHLHETERPLPIVCCPQVSSGIRDSLPKRYPFLTTTIVTRCGRC